MLYLHHLEAKHKHQLRRIVRVSRRYNVTGAFKVGQPGYIFIDGAPSDVQNSIKFLKVCETTSVIIEDSNDKCLNGQEITVTIHEDYTSDSPGTESPEMIRCTNMDIMWKYMRRNNLRAFFMNGMFTAGFKSSVTVAAEGKNENI